MENYIVRIYRRDPSDPDGIIGVARELGSDRNLRFGSFQELRRILCIGDSRPPRRKRGVRCKGRRSRPA